MSVCVRVRIVISCELTERRCVETGGEANLRMNIRHVARACKGSEPGRGESPKRKCVLRVCEVEVRSLQ